MLINNEHGTFAILEDKIFYVEIGHIFETGPISEEEKKEIVLTNCYVAFKKNGLLHRDNDLPSVICVNGTRFWYKDNNLYRENGKPAIIQLHKR
jgi:hypothetical protein